jgi:hypothetical protein
MNVRRYLLAMSALATIVFAAGAPKIAGFCFGGGC